MIEVGMILDNRFFLMWLAPVVVSFFSLDAYGITHFFQHVSKVAFYGWLFFYLFYGLLNYIKVQILVAILKNIMLLLSLLFALIDFFASHYFNMEFTQSLVDTLLATNFRESYEFLVSTMLSHGFLIVGLVIFCVIFLYKVHLEIRLSKKIHVLLITALILGISLHIARGIYLRGNLQGALIAMRNTTLFVIPVLKEGYAIYASLKEHTHMQAVINSFRQPYPRDYMRVEANKVPNVVLIIGESASKNFMELYGYSVPNTPFLSSLLEREIAKFIRV
ncbi:sulfatase-like hydrolase/transferase [Helicobacter salomonis]|uniref:sulfatase-like hydrolase/transferase n=1 Tax=Helicobacter salomonis TaxID=56878 RepID=UPI002278BDD9|nr:sulfatase-like hydrolase/transferase [Helicobacter salomonis]